MKRERAGGPAAESGNCLCWALGQWRRHGGYLIVRRSHWGWWWHFLWSRDLTEFAAYEPAAPPRRRWLPPLWFRGQVVRGAK